MGFKPDDFAFISFIKTFDYNHQNPLSSTEIENLRSMYQDNLVQESIDVVEDMAEQEAIRQSFVNDPFLKEVDIDEKNIDSGWLTDDNITYILNNHERIQEAIKQRTSIQVRTDIANIYFHYEKNKSEEEIRGFVKELNLDKFMYTFLPLRVNGNHWGLLIDCGGGNDFYYVSSSQEESNKTQVERVEGFLKKFNPQANVEVISTPSRQNNSYDCGVYLIFYI